MLADILISAKNNEWQRARWILLASTKGVLMQRMQRKTESGNTY